MSTIEHDKHLDLKVSYLDTVLLSEYVRHEGINLFYWPCWLLILDAKPSQKRLYS